MEKYIPSKKTHTAIVWGPFEKFQIKWEQWTEHPKPLQLSGVLMDVRQHVSNHITSLGVSKKSWVIMTDDKGHPIDIFRHPYNSFCSKPTTTIEVLT